MFHSYESNVKQLDLITMRELTWRYNTPSSNSKRNHLSRPYSCIILLFFINRCENVGPEAWKINVLVNLGGKISITRSQAKANKFLLRFVTREGFPDLPVSFCRSVSFKPRNHGFYRIPRKQKTVSMNKFYQTFAIQKLLHQTYTLFSNYESSIKSSPKTKSGLMQRYLIALNILSIKIV